MSKALSAPGTLSYIDFMALQHRSILSDLHYAASLPGQAHLALARALIFMERHWRVCWRFYAVLGIFLAACWFGLFLLLPEWLHLLALALALAAALASLRDTGLGWRWPSIYAAARRLEADSKLAHRPFEALSSRPVGVTTDAAVRGLWKIHREQAQMSLRGLRLPRPRFRRSGSDRWGVVYWVPLLLVGAVLTGWGELGPRLAHTFVVAAMKPPSLGGPAIVFDAWITPPAYTKLPPIMLAQSESHTLRDDTVTVPAGSTMAFRINFPDSGHHAKPRLRIAGHDTKFKDVGNGGYTLDGPVPDVSELDVRLGWSSYKSWHIVYQPDLPPTVVWRSDPKINGQDVVLSMQL